MYECPGYWHHLTSSWYRWCLPSIPGETHSVHKTGPLGFIKRILTFHSSYFWTTITPKYNTDVTLGITQYNTEGAWPLHSIANTYITVEDINTSFLLEKLYLAKEGSTPGWVATPGLEPRTLCFWAQDPTTTTSWNNIQARSKYTVYSVNVCSK